MATEVRLPRLGQGMAAGTVVRWLKAVGERVEKGEPLYEVETEKVTQEVEAEVAGVLLQILVREGEVPVGRTVALVGEPEEAGSAGGAPGLIGEARLEPAPAPERRPTVSRSSLHAAEGRVKASPLARRVARERGVELAGVVGSGLEGRVVAADVERATAGEVLPAAAAGAAVAGVERVPLSQLRRTVARRMVEAWQVPAFQISMSAEMTRCLELRARLVERHPEARPTVTDILVRVCALALVRHREVNALFAGDAVELYRSVNIGIAVATERGLVVPVLAACERLSVAEIAAGRADLAGRAREGRLRNADFEGGTFTISNLGMAGVERFAAVLNPPQAAILAVGAVEERPVARDGAVMVRPLVTLTLTCDHRALDGAAAAGFLRTVKELLEEPGLAL